ncbi:hypothetical protein C2G38_163489 [Gigaspora rosea]|uniref:Uncharacterized protein n=1 Tax=Gigaspora rosea TaxID=44941 RepID=A0A397UMP3_9GLOM|nr:hypothetical protein C2G38_163489 [Gigaspora rosea]
MNEKLDTITSYDLFRSKLIKFLLDKFTNCSSTCRYFGYIYIYGNGIKLIFMTNICTMYSEEDINHEESSSLDTLKQKFDRLYETSKFQNFATVSVVTFIGFSQSDTTSKITSIANAIIEKNVFGQSACCVKNCNCRSSKATLLTTNGKNVKI